MCRLCGMMQVPVNEVDVPVIFANSKEEKVHGPFMVMSWDLLEEVPGVLQVIRNGMLGQEERKVMVIWKLKNGQTLELAVFGSLIGGVSRANMANTVWILNKYVHMLPDDESMDYYANLNRKYKLMVDHVDSRFVNVSCT